MAADVPERTEVPSDFWHVYDAYHGSVRRFIVATVKDEWAADDLVQDTFIRVHEKLHTVNEPAKVKAWVFRVAHNLCLDYFRGGSSVRKREESLTPWEAEAEASTTQKLLERCQMSACVQDKIACVAEPSRSVLVLFDIMELSHQEIADVLGISVGNVKVRLHRARKALKDKLERECHFERDERGVVVCVPGSPKPCSTQT